MAGCEEHKREHEALAAAQGGGAESQSEGFQVRACACVRVCIAGEPLITRFPLDSPG